MRTTDLKRISKQISKRQGAFAILFAILLPLILVFLGFSIDFANMQRSRNELRVIADLAAKAASDTLARTDGDTAEARRIAKQVAASNFVAGKPLTLSDDEIEFGRSELDPDTGVWTFNKGATPANSVMVLAARDSQSVDGPIPLMFGQFYGVSGFESSQMATAGFQDTDVMLVLDRSGSMKRDIEYTGTPTQQELNDILPPPGSRWLALDHAVDLFLNQLESSNSTERVGLVTFAHHDGANPAATLDAPLGEDTQRVRDAIQNLTSSVWRGRTDIEAGLQEARRHLSRNSAEIQKRVIIVLTDGKYNEGFNPAIEALRCGDEGIVVHTITFSNEANETDMIETAAAGRGGHYHAPDEAQLRDIFTRLAASLSVLQE